MTEAFLSSDPDLILVARIPPLLHGSICFKKHCFFDPPSSLKGISREQLLMPDKSPLL